MQVDSWVTLDRRLWGLHDRDLRRIRPSWVVAGLFAGIGAGILVSVWHMPFGVRSWGPWFAAMIPGMLAPLVDWRWPHWFSGRRLFQLETQTGTHEKGFVQVAVHDGIIETQRAGFRDVSPIDTVCQVTRHEGTTVLWRTFGPPIALGSDVPADRVEALVAALDGPSSEIQAFDQPATVQVWGSFAPYETPTHLGGLVLALVLVAFVVDGVAVAYLLAPLQVPADVWYGVLIVVGIACAFALWRLGRTQSFPVRLHRVSVDGEEVVRVALPMWAGWLGNVQVKADHNAKRIRIGNGGARHVDVEYTRDVLEVLGLLDDPAGSAHRVT